MKIAWGESSSNAVVMESKFLLIWEKSSLIYQRVYETRTATPAETSSEIPESKSSFCTLPLIYHPKGQNKAPYNSEMLENDIFTLETNIQND